MSLITLKSSQLSSHGTVACPNPALNTAVSQWNSHPKVNLTVPAHGEVKCPYCGTQYAMAAGETVAHGH